MTTAIAWLGLAAIAACLATGTWRAVRFFLRNQYRPPYNPPAPPQNTRRQPHGAIPIVP